MMRALLFLILLFLGSGAAHAEWRRAESAHFIVQAEMSEQEIREYTVLLERFDQLLRRVSNVTEPPGPVKFRVYVVSTAGAVRRQLGEGGDAAGFYSASLRGPFAVAPRRAVGRGPFRMTSQHILFHEYAHHFMLQYFPTSYPAWYIEGFAEFYSTVSFREDGGVEIGLPVNIRVASLAYGHWISFERMLANEMANQEMTYAQGWLLTHYIVFNPEAGVWLRDYLNAIHAGRSGAEAYAATFGRAEPSLDRRLRAYFNQGRISVITANIETTAADVEVAMLSRETAEVALMRAQGQDTQRLAARIAERYPDNAQAQAELALASIEADDFAAASAAVDGALALDPALTDALLAKGWILIEQAHATGDGEEPRWTEARTLMLRANRANPLDATPLFGYFMSFPEAGQSSEALRALEGAFGLVPQNPMLRARIGVEYLRLGHFAEARAAVMPLVQSPHSGAMGEVARQMLAMADAGIAGERVDVEGLGDALAVAGDESEDR